MILNDLITLRKEKCEVGVYGVAGIHNHNATKGSITLIMSFTTNHVRRGVK